MEEAKAEDMCREDAYAVKNNEIAALKNQLGAVADKLKSAEVSQRQTKSKLDTVSTEAQKGSQASVLIDQMLAAGVIKMEDNGTVSMVPQTSEQQLMGNADTN